MSEQPGAEASDEQPARTDELARDELRAELGQTVDELSRRVDVPARVQARRAELTERAHQLGGQARLAVGANTARVTDSAARVPTPVWWAVGAAAVLGLVVAVRGRDGTP